MWEIGIDPGIFCRCELSRTLTLRGFPDQGLRHAQQAVAEGRALEHPQVVAFALLFEIFVHVARRDAPEVLRAYQQLEDICSARGIAQELQWAAPFRDRALVEMGQVDRGVAQMGESLQAHTITRSALLRPYYLVLYAGSLLRVGKLDDAQRALDESAQFARDTVQHSYDAEHARLQAEVFSARGRADAAEESHRHGLEIAHTQGARWLELRSARAYANFLAGAGRIAEARAVLEPTYASITEGHQAFDMVAAEALLKTLNQQ